MKYLLFVLLYSSAVFSETMTLDEKSLVSMIQERNGRISGQQLNIEASKAETGYLQRSFLPRVQLSIGREHTDGTPVTGPENSYSYARATATLNVFNGGRDVLRENVRNEIVKQSQSEYERELFALLTQARILYWQMIYQNEIINVLENSVKLNESNLRSARKKIDNNLATITDEIDFTQTRIQIDQDLKKARIVLQNNSRSMAALLNHPLDMKYVVPDINTHEADHTLDEFSSRFNGESFRDIRLLEAQGSVNQLQGVINQRWWTPEFNLYAAKANRFETLKRTNELDLDQGEIYGVRLTFFFDGFESRATSVAQSYRTQSFTHYRNQRLQEIQSEYSNAYQLYVLNHDLIHSAEENNKIAQKYYENIWSEYMRGIKNSPDVLQAFQRVIDARIRYADIKKDYQVARAEILGLLQE